MPVMSRNALAVEKNEDADAKKKSLDAGKQVNSELARQDASMDVTLDILAHGLRTQGRGQRCHRLPREDANPLRLKDDDLCRQGRRAIQAARHG